MTDIRRVPKKSESRSLYVIDFLYAVLLELGTGGGDEEQEFIEDEVLTAVHEHAAHVVLEVGFLQPLNGCLGYLVIEVFHA